MSDLTITPDQIKTIAQHMRGEEERRIGQKLPNTTALNTITRALGLGEDFRAFKASCEAARAKAAPTIIRLNINVVFKNLEDGEELLEAVLHDALLGELAATGLVPDLQPGAHGYSVLMLWADGPATEADLAAKRAAVDRIIETHVSRGVLAPPLAAMGWLTPSDDKDLLVNFLYMENDQVATAGVSRAAWVARSQLGQRDDDMAFFTLYFDIEIDASENANTIMVQDIFESFELFCD